MNCIALDSTLQKSADKLAEKAEKNLALLQRRDCKISFIPLYRLTEYHKETKLFESSCEKFYTNAAICKDTRESDSTNCKETSVSLNSNPFLQKYAESFQYFLDDEKGVALFEKFLKERKYDTACFFFCFACRGLKKINPTEAEKFHKLSRLVYEKLVKRIRAISSSTKREIEQKLGSSSGLDIHVFDKAQREVEDYMLRIIFPEFLSSDFFSRQYLLKEEIKLERQRAITLEPSVVLPKAKL
ncbi:hypothetical protein AVEN_239657-1 [Araneus ventricosus]|uniref:RGS domain-containing protein n=1 Tax=Araneus ventricosus TaxID=182803 RepID=A0A4Y2CS41_ARAVE|nr:hypothetical protein AVEN_239657-1 [Araneus ventricosus]